MKYKRIQYFIVYILLISCLFISKDQSYPAAELWLFLFTNLNETNILLFFIINLFYLSMLYLYIPSKKILFKLLHFIFNRVYYLKVILFLLDIYYFIYLKYFKVKQVCIVKIHLYILSNTKYLNSYLKNCLYLSIFDDEIFLPHSFTNNIFIKQGNFKDDKERQFYLNLYKDFYLLFVYVKLNNRLYRLTLLEFIDLIILHTYCKLNGFKKIIFQFKSNSKILNKFVKLISFWTQIQDLYSELRKANFSLGIKFYLQNFCCALFMNYDVKPTIDLLKLFKKDRRLIRQFIILLLYKNIKLFKKLIKKKKIILDLDQICNKKPSISILNVNNIHFKFFRPQYYQFKKIEFNLFYLFFKNISTLKNLYKSIVVSNFFKEFKIGYQLIKFSLFFYILSFFILKNLLSIIAPMYFLSIFSLRLFYTYKIIEDSNYWYNKRLVTHTLFRIIYYYSIYYFNFFIFPLDNFYFIILNYLVNIFIFIIIISLYDIHSNFFYLEKFGNLDKIYPRFKGMTINEAIRFKITETIHNWVKNHPSNYLSLLYIKYYNFLQKERKIYSQGLYKNKLKK